MDSSGDDSGGEDRETPFPELLNFCSRAQTLIAELLLLSDRLPAQFRDPKFDPVLFDLRYFDSAGDFEAKIQGNGALEAVEDELRESCSDYMERFFVFVNAAAVYYLELRRYLDDLKEGVYVQRTLDKALETECGLQLLAESMSSFGCLLLLMEHRMSGYVREKLLVAHIRHRHCSETLNSDTVFLLCRAHLPTAGSLRHASSPTFNSAVVLIQKSDDLFGRFPFPKLVVDAVISRLRDGDIYNQTCYYPDPQHRSVALSLQAGCLYVMLFFSPEFLHNSIIMREIVDRFFKGCWVVPIFLYFCVDLFASWDAYKEAKASLSSCFSSTFVRDCSQHYCSQVTNLLSEVKRLLGNGVLTEDYVLHNYPHLLSLVRNCNITLRWLLLHRSSVDKRLRDVVATVGLGHQVNEDTLLLLLLRSSQLEFEVKQLYMKLLKGRQVIWQEKKHYAYGSIQELSRHCSGAWASSYKIKNESLMDLLGKFSLEVQSLVCTKSENADETIYHVISSLKDIEQYHQVQESIQIKQQLTETQKCLQDMIEVLELDHDFISTFSMISDSIYAWGYIARFCELLGKKIEQDPPVLLFLHSFFLKFCTLLNAPLMRIKQNRSPDLLYISQYYTAEYEAQIFGTLQIIPVMILRIFTEGRFETGQAFHLLNLHNDNLQDFTQWSLQVNLAKAAKEISILSEGITVMSRNFHSIISQDFSGWLKKQIHKELSNLIDEKLNSFFSCANAEAEKLETNMKTLSNYILSCSHMMESFQDVLHLNRCHIWEEAFTEVLEQCAQKEHAHFIKIRQKSFSSPTFSKDLSNARTFFGHLLCQILQLTDPSRTMFLEPMSGWFDAEGRELLALHFFDLLYSCVGQVGLARLDSLLSLLLEKNLGHALEVSKHLLDAGCLEEIKKMDDLLGPPTSLPFVGGLSYKQMIKSANKSWDPWVDTLAFIGQLQLLRCLVSLKLKSACKVNAGVISFAAEGMITAIYSGREMLYKCLESEGKDAAAIRCFLEALNRQQNLCGFSSPLHTHYISDDPPTYMSRFAFVFSIAQLKHYVLDTHLGALTSRSKKSITDFSPLVIGLGTLLYQFHPSLMSQYLQYMGQYVRIAAEGALDEPQKGYTDTSSEVQKTVFWLLYFCKYMSVPQDVVDSCLPPSLVSLLQS